MPLLCVATNGGRIMLRTDRRDGHDDVKATPDVSAPLICGRFRLGFCHDRDKRGRDKNEKGPEFPPGLRIFAKPIA